MQKEITYDWSANDHLAEEFSFLRKIFHQFILGHPNKILTLPKFQLVRCNHLRLEKELLKEREDKDGTVTNIQYLIIANTGNVSIHIILSALSAQATTEKCFRKSTLKDGELVTFSDDSIAIWPIGAFPTKYVWDRSPRTDSNADSAHWK